MVVIRDSVEDPLLEVVGPCVTMDRLIGNGYNTMVGQEAIFHLQFAWPPILLHFRSLSLVRTSVHVVQIRSGNVGQEPDIHLAEVHGVEPRSGDVVGGPGREILNGGGHLGDEGLPVILGSIRSSLTAAVVSLVFILFFIIRIFITRGKRWD